MSPGGPLAGPLFYAPQGDSWRSPQRQAALSSLPGGEESRIDDQAGHRLVKEAAHDGVGKHLISEVLVLTQP